MATRKMPKPPKKPKKSASETVLKNYLERHKEWKKKVNEINAAKKRRESLLKQVNGVK
jgi:hypothetical protein